MLATSDDRDAKFDFEADFARVVHEREQAKQQLVDALERPLGHSAWSKDLPRGPQPIFASAYETPQSQSDGVSRALEALGAIRVDVALLSLAVLVLLWQLVSPGGASAAKPPPFVGAQDAASFVLALAPSGVDGLPLTTQAGLFVATFVSLGALSYASAALYDLARPAQPTSDYWDTWEAFSAVLLGVVFVTAGRSHFTLPEAFRSIYPPIGTWGFWFLPGSKEFHVAWTGVAELLGGSGLLAGGGLRVLAPARSRPLLPWAARGVALLVACVTPANFYMFSHGALMPGIVDEPLPMAGHALRFAAQASVLSVLLTLSEGLPSSAAEQQQIDTPRVED